MASQYPLRSMRLVRQYTVTSLNWFTKDCNFFAPWAPQWQRFLAHSSSLSIGIGGLDLNGDALLKFAQEQIADAYASLAFAFPPSSLLQLQSHSSRGFCNSGSIGWLRSVPASHASYVNASNLSSPAQASRPLPAIAAITVARPTGRAFNTQETRHRSLTYVSYTSRTAVASSGQKNGNASTGYCTMASGGGSVGSGGGAAKVSPASDDGSGGEQDGPSQSHAAEGSATNRRSADAHEATMGRGNGGGSVAVGGDAKGSPLGRIQPRLMMVFTCAKCETRSTKSFSKQSYTQGVVLVRCPGCQKLHLIADHLCWFGEEPFMLHEFLAGQGKNVIRVTVDERPDTTTSQPADFETATSDPATGPRPAPAAQSTGPAAAVAAPAIPGLAARAAAAAAALAASEGGVFELGSELQVREALAAARDVQDHCTSGLREAST
ncbi:hypothetical protein Vretimale_11125 [Volvox reticuliferus]|uniref:DNL-type domain-containing protein n=1 Tax=Volvox reticuliferus TaxID=1737510 RepID=A0A8J4CJ46_9CHLO|nr:hypothetical protein Vretifemale_12845 [Volvox reticuliferus]GIM06879.1 hypothetical protein Vretimale_11125 [Volvox reticuliferus]